MSHAAPRAFVGLAFGLTAHALLCAELPAAPAPGGPELRILYPFEEAVFPIDIAPPTFRWRDAGTACDTWTISFRTAEGSLPITAVVATNEWCPDTTAWEALKQASLSKPVHVEVAGRNRAAGDAVVCRADRVFSTSPDPVDAPIFYRDVNLPFAEAVKDPSDIKWRLGAVSFTNPPPVVMANLPVCGNCHSFSRDGRLLGMDIDYANSKGSYVITSTATEMVLEPRDIITWDDFRRADGELTFGLLSQVSPDGRWVVSTVKDKSVFVPRPELAFSQLFFPIKGILATYHRETGTFASLPGADDPALVQSNPTWSPDGRWVVFARTKAYDLSASVGQGKVLLTPEECREFLKDGKPFRFDLYRIPFNEGRGGQPMALAGASDDGLSNYFPKYSPDGRWIVFCKSKSYMLLQPDSELHIIPAAGGSPRRLRANLSRMNSWHSWSPNGRWLVFSSKALSDYTQLFLTHIDAEGNSAPPVLLERFTAPTRAANIPEFVNLPPAGIVSIQERFLNDYSFERAGNEFYRAGDTDHAIEKYRRALELNPGNVTAHQRLGFLLYHVKGNFQAGMAETAEALRLDPQHGLAHSDMGIALLNQNQPAQAIPHLEAALASLPRTTEKRYQPEAIRCHLAQACLRLGRSSEAVRHLTESVRLAPNDPEARYLLALACAREGVIDEAVRQYQQATALKPSVDTSVTLHEILAEHYAQAGRVDDAVRSAERALQIARTTGKAELAERASARLARYQALRPEPRQGAVRE